MMDYQNTALQQSAVAGRPEPELGKIKAAVERVAMAANRIETFIYRFSGPIGGGESAATAPQPPESYRNDINALFDQLDRLNNVVNVLDHIG